MEIEIKCCNNVDSAKITIAEKKLNIKYALNGTGKSTLATILECSINHKDDILKSLTPFKYRNSELSEKNKPSISGLTDNIRSIAVFNEAYVNQYVYQPDELIKNSFEIFVKNDNYVKLMADIQKLTSEIQSAFTNMPEIDALISDMTSFLDSCKKTQTGISKSSNFHKAFKDGNKIEGIPDELKIYENYLKNDNATKWLKWHQDGLAYLDISARCPYCVDEIESKKSNIKKLSETYDSKTITFLNNIIKIFERLGFYFAEKTKSQVNIITKKAIAPSKDEEGFIFEICTQVETLNSMLGNIKNISYKTLKEKEIDVYLKSLKINLDLYSHLNTEHTKGKIKPINDKLEELIIKSGELKGAVNKQKAHIVKTIEDHKKQINDFLQSAGYFYQVDICENEAKDYKICLRYKDGGLKIETPVNHLSYGEKNAFALVMFLYDTLKKNPDLIVLDDPISSFDGNKKFALINLLFMGSGKFKDKTVLLLTHEFNTVIDIMLIMKGKMVPPPVAHFLENKDNILSEKEIKSEDIRSFIDIANENIANANNRISKLIYLRRRYELEKEKVLAWNMLSDIFHKRDVPSVYRKNEEVKHINMTEDEKQKALADINKGLNITNFDFEETLNFVKDTSEMMNLYNQATNNYEKLQIYRIIFAKDTYDKDVNNGDSGDPIFKKYVNETFHIENDSLFQVNPMEYEVVPHYVIALCDTNMKKLQEEK